MTKPALVEAGSLASEPKAGYRAVPELPAKAADLIRQLLTHAKQDVPDPLPLQNSLSESHAVLLKIEVDDVVCLLLRPRKTEDDPCALSPREQEIARMIARGHANKTIAEVLDISPWTVNTHVRRIFLKTGVCSRAAMVSRLAELGLLK